MYKQYKKMFKENGEKTCDCSICAKENCGRRDMDFCLDEACPTGTRPYGASCAVFDSEGKPQKKIPNHCPDGYIWSSKDHKCILMNKK